MNECRCCRGPVIATFALPRGCMVYPDDREQSLCPQHIVSATPIGTMDLLRVLDAEAWHWFTESQARRPG